MKKIFILIILSIFTCSYSLMAQCNAESYNEACIAEIQSRGYTFVKSYKIDGAGGAKAKIEYSYVFSKDTEYLFAINGKDGEANGIVLTIYDSNRKLITTNYDKVNKKFYKAINFPCKVTGIYYMTFTFEGSKSHCAAAVVGFKR
ncbi:MAG TPA: hypothetical protein VD908_18675 [Cytophagales bacterium]|nr:hypothetical protein [Cytophagales bacterium]